MTISFNSLGNLGGLGNQMFQFAFLLSVSKSQDLKITIPKKFNDNIRDDYLLSDVFKLNNQINYATSNFERFNFKSDINIIVYDKRILNFDYYEKDLYGYFQSYKYFDDIKDIIFENFHFHKQIRDEVDILSIKNKLILSSTIFMHIRGSDYLNKSEYHFNLGEDYYKKSLKHFPDEMKCLVFTDDINYAKKFKFLNNPRFIFVNDLFENNENNLQSAFELRLMTLCNGGIIANSSYSWWGAFLQNHKNTIVSPHYKYWFGYKYNFNAKNLILPSWKQIKPKNLSRVQYKIKPLIGHLRKAKTKLKKLFVLLS